MRDMNGIYQYVNRLLLDGRLDDCNALLKGVAKQVRILDDDILIAYLRILTATNSLSSELKFRQKFSCKAGEELRLRASYSDRSLFGGWTNDLLRRMI